MDEKEIVSSRNMSKELILNFVVWGVLAGLLYQIAIVLIIGHIDSLILKSIFVVLMQGIFAYLTWMCSTSSSFKKKTIVYDDVSKVMKNLLIFTIIICLINIIYNFYNVNKSIDENIKSSFQLQMNEKWMNSFYSQEQMEEYNVKKQEAIKDIKNKSYIYLAIIEIGLTAVYLAVLPLEKKQILKHVS